MTGKRLRFARALAAFVLIGLTGVQGAEAFTIATFADPAVDGTTPLFTLDKTTNTFSGEWSGTGLTLQIPGLAAPDVVDATFTMTPMVGTPLFQAPGLELWSLPAGTIQFFDSSNALVLQIDFDGAAMSVPFGFGASEFGNLSNVTFSGPMVPAGLTEEGFGFSFANAIDTGNGFTVTASFTSSAVPEPRTVMVVAMGLPLLLLARRRR